MNHGNASSGYDHAATARRTPEPPKRPGRTPFQRDRARVLHSAALRRLSAKTQVVEVGAADFPRTRLTHSLECAQIGRELGAEIGCDPDLVDAACLAHDIGHPPFGHNGEAALAELAAVWGVGEAGGGFEGNAQSLRLLTRLEQKVPGVGLNLTRATLDATLKYPWLGDGSGKYGAYQDDAEVFAWIREGAPPGRPCLEAQVMDWADDVAYSVHDLEDGLQAGMITFKNLQDHAERDVVAALAATTYCAPDVTVAELGAVFDDLLALDAWPTSFDRGPASLAALKNLTSDLIGRFCVAAQEATRAARAEHATPNNPINHVSPATSATSTTTTSSITSTSKPASTTSTTSTEGHFLTRYAADLVVPRTQRLECALLKAVTHRYVMTRPGVAAAQARERELITELAEAVEREAPATLDPLLRPAWAAAPTDAARRRVVIDHIASLTDTSAIAHHTRLCR